MALLIDEPLWWWQGRRWAHLISDSNLDELHDEARQIGLRYLSFGFDHYDVPEELYGRATEVAQVVDPREIVRTLRESGLRTIRTKSEKRWRRTPTLPAGEWSGSIDTWEANAAAVLNADEREVLQRPGEGLLLLVGSIEPGLLPPPPGCRVFVTQTGNRWSIELLVSTQLRVD